MVEATIASRADDAQGQITAQVGAVQTQFQQSLLRFRTRSPGRQ